MKKFTKFQKQIIAIVSVLLVAGLCFGAYFIFFDKDTELTASFPFNAEELKAAKKLGRTNFTFAAEKGKATTEEAYMMHLAEGYASVNKKVSVSYGVDDEACQIISGGKTYVVDMDKEFIRREDGTAYASTVRAFFNNSLFGKDFGITTEALPGFNLYGDMVNSSGGAYIYDPIQRENIKYIYVKNQYDELTFIPESGTFYLLDSVMDLNTSVSATLVAAVRSPVATNIIPLEYKTDAEYNKLLADYGLDDDEKLNAAILIEDDDGNASYLKIGKALSDGTGFYALCHGKKDRIYVMQQSISNYILVPKEKFLIANYGTPLEDLALVYSTVTDIEIGIGEDEPLKAVFMTDEEKKNHPINYSWKITGPDRFISGEFDYALPEFGNIGDLLNTLCAMSSDTVVSATVDDESLKEYGLDTPYRSYSWLHKGKEEDIRCTVHFSKPTDDGYLFVYGIKENVTEKEKEVLGISRIAKSKFAYLDYTVMDYLDTKLYTQYFDRLDTMSFTRNGTEYVVNFTKDSAGLVTAARINGKDTDLLSCRNFYKNLLHCYVLGEYKGEDSPKELLEISLTANDKTAVLSFGRISNMKAYCLVSGKTEYEMDYVLLETLIANVDALIAGEVIK